MLVHPDLQRVEHAHAASSRGRCTIGVIAAGWPSDLTESVTAMARYSSPDISFAIVDCGNMDGAGHAAEDLRAEHPDRVTVAHVAGTLDDVGWGPAMKTLIAMTDSPFFAALDTATIAHAPVMDGLLAPFADPAVAVTGWKGANVNTTDWYSFDAAGPGEVDVVMGYLMCVRTDVAREIPPHKKAKFYRNAELEWCLAIRAGGHKIVVPSDELALTQERHRGYHDSDPDFRDEQSKRNYRRMLDRFKGREDILAPRN